MSVELKCLSAVRCVSAHVCTTRAVTRCSSSRQRWWIVACRCVGVVGTASGQAVAVHVLALAGHALTDTTAARALRSHTRPPRCLRAVFLAAGGTRCTALAGEGRCRTVMRVGTCRCPVAAVWQSSAPRRARRTPLAHLVTLPRSRCCRAPAKAENTWPLDGVHVKVLVRAAQGTAALLLEPVGPGTTRGSNALCRCACGRVAERPTAVWQRVWGASCVVGESPGACATICRQRSVLGALGATHSCRGQWRRASESRNTAAARSVICRGWSLHSTLG